MCFSISYYLAITSNKSLFVPLPYFTWPSVLFLYHKLFVQIRLLQIPFCFSAFLLIYVQYVTQLLQNAKKYMSKQKWCFPVSKNRIHVIGDFFFSWTLFRLFTDRQVELTNIHELPGRFNQANYSSQHGSEMSSPIQVNNFQCHQVQVFCHHHMWHLCHNLTWLWHFPIGHCSWNMCLLNFEEKVPMGKTHASGSRLQWSSHGWIELLEGLLISMGHSMWL